MLRIVETDGVPSALSDVEGRIMCALEPGHPDAARNARLLAMSPDLLEAGAKMARELGDAGVDSPHARLFLAFADYIDPKEERDEQFGGAD